MTGLVTNFLAGLGEDEPPRFSPTVERLLGVLPESATLDEYRSHLETKYGQ